MPAEAARSTPLAKVLADTLPAARHMARALGAQRGAVSSMDPEYVRLLFEGYADSYDAHANKLLYSAPR